MNEQDVGVMLRIQNNDQSRPFRAAQPFADRLFGVVVHGDTEGADTLRRSLTDWLTDMDLVPATAATLDRYVGYYQPYATSHDALDADEKFQEEVRNVARSLGDALGLARTGNFERSDRTSRDPRPK